MSSMLEQAIIDAAALRETALKSAEASLIEKYKDEFKESVEKLLEQEMEPQTAAANAADPTGPTVVPQEPPPTQMGSPTVDKPDPFKKVKNAFFDLDGDDDELITINFDQLKAKPVKNSSALLSQPQSEPQMMLSTPQEAPQQDQTNLSEEIELDLEELSEALIVKVKESYANPGDDSYHRGQVEEELDEDEEYELELDESAASLSLKKTAGDLKKQAAQKEAEATGIEAQDAEVSEKEAERQRLEKQKADQESKSSLEEDIELTEEELLELEESLKIDMDNASEGYIGSHKRKEREFKKIAFAKARDDKEAKKLEMAKKTIGDLQEQLSSEKKKSSSLDVTNSNLLKAVSSLKEQLEKINLSNAKLLYTNKVLSNISLNERQKNNIVENITRASTVLEAKTIYETLQSNVQSIKEKAPKSLSEALNRGPSPFLVRRSQSTSVSDIMSERMKLLAGIKQD